MYRPAGALYVKLRGVPVNFEIEDSKARFKGLGGRKKVKDRVELEATRPGPHAPD